MGGVRGPLGQPGVFDFADRSFVGRRRGHLEGIVTDRAAWHSPPVETLCVQRKISGTALLAVKMQARFALRDLVAKVLAENEAPRSSEPVQ